ncbi:MAG TPA: (2Fe-2S) ferredoxin domain-containing protein, partial [Deltaproteobacteria bacterium]|nr:(2Fe-2S) ferredoxin domain-containing protein [Deltaproteobacteria bacterium]
MAKLTINDLKKIKEKVEREDQFRAGEKRVKITVHMGTCGIASGAKGILDTFMKEISEANVNDVLITT